ncbi:MAG: hypothetical protein ACREOM_14175 [Candidatus Dormibacteraceae bacterium]
MSPRRDGIVDYHERRAGEYDAKSWDHPDSEQAAAEQVRFVLGAMPTAHTHKCYFTAARLVEDLGGGEVIMDGPVFVVARRRR